jgi:hypothetical protein
MTHKIAPATTGKRFRQRKARTAIIASTIQDFLTNHPADSRLNKAGLFSRFFSLFTCLKKWILYALTKLSETAFVAYLLRILLLTTKFSVL